MKNVVKRAVLLSKDRMITAGSLPPEITDTKTPVPDLLAEALASGDLHDISLKSIAERAEREAILKVMKQTNNNKTKTAALLKVDRKTLYNKLKN